MGQAAAVTALSVLTGAYQAKKQERISEKRAEAQKRTDEINAQKASLSAARDRAKRVRAARIARGTAAAQAAGSGAGTGGSGLIGVKSGITSKMAADESFLSQQGQLSGQLSEVNQTLAEQTAELQGDIAVGGIFQTGIQTYGKFKTSS